MTFVATHIGLMRHYTFETEYMNIQLRETKCYWVTQAGTKFRKSDGQEAGGGSWSQWKLDLDSVKMTPQKETP